MSNPALTILKRELAGYFTTPLAYVFLVVFLLLHGALGFFLGGFFDRNQADLTSFLTFQPWLYLFLIPALTMRMWAEERKTGTIELLLTLPVTVTQAVLGKFLAAWLCVGAALLLTMPLWATVNWLGQPDNGVVAAGYAASWLLAGALIAMGAFCSALSRNQVVAFVLGAALSLLFLLAGTPVLLEAVGHAPQAVQDAVGGLSLLQHFENIARGQVRLVDVAFFVLLAVFFLWATILTVKERQAQ